MGAYHMHVLVCVCVSVLVLVHVRCQFVDVVWFGPFDVS